MTSIVLCCRMVLGLRDYKPEMPVGTTMTIPVTNFANGIPLSVTHDWKGHDILSGMYNVG